MEQNNDLFVNIDQKAAKEKESLYEEMLEGRSKPEVKPAQENIANLKTETIDQILTKNSQTELLKKYTHEEALVQATQYFDGDTLAANVWMNKYALKDSDGNIYELTPDDMHWRLANELARIESKYENPLSAQEIWQLFEQGPFDYPQG